jgi:iron complex outermembrane receptor protein
MADLWLAPSTTAQVTVGLNHYETLSVAGYADANLRVSEFWDNTPDITLTGGIRVGWEQKSHDVFQTSQGALGALPTPVSGPDIGPYSQSEDDTYVTGRAVLKWDADIPWEPLHQLMLYASYATGYKSGGYNQLRTTGADSDPSKLWFGPESSQSIELGIRTTWLERMLTFNITGFFTDYDDFQALVFDGLGISVENAGRFITAGLEADLTIVPVPEWITVFGIGYTYTEYKDFPDGPCVQQESLLIGGQNCVQDLAGKRLDGTPRLDITLFSSYERALPTIDVKGLPSDANWFVSGNFNYQSTRWLNAALDPKLKTPRTKVLDLQTGLRSPDLDWELIFWVKNVTDEDYAVIGFDIPTMGGYASFLSPPRTIGGTIRLRF